MTLWWNLYQNFFALHNASMKLLFHFEGIFLITSWKVILQVSRFALDFIKRIAQFLKVVLINCRSDLVNLGFISDLKSVHSLRLFDILIVNQKINSFWPRNLLDLSFWSMLWNRLGLLLISMVLGFLLLQRVWSLFEVLDEDSWSQVAVWTDVVAISVMSWLMLFELHRVLLLDLQNSWNLTAALLELRRRIWIGQALCLTSDTEIYSSS